MEMIELKVGDAFRERECKLHIRGFVDDEVIFRIWSRSKQYWRYRAESRWLFNHMIKSGVYVRVK